ncbi:MAG: LPS export ABC transporter periplasmic protein LptC [Alistipes sp.]|nr:LPS export ABC transporter periplasmic protein LptC [Alistipes sp.]
MGIKTTISNMRTALLIAGSAFCIYSCNSRTDAEEEDFEGLMTQKAENLKIIESENGKLSYRVQTPLMETYEYDREPFREFRKGIFVETFSDTTNTVETTLVGDYAIYYINRKLWEVKGNVVSTNANGQKLETQQLFWNQLTGRIYSNVDSKLTQGNDVIIGVGFESDEQFVDWEFRRPRGTVEVDVESTRTPGEGEDDDGEFTVTVRDGDGNEITRKEATGPVPDEGVSGATDAGMAETVPVAPGNGSEGRTSAPAGAAGNGGTAPAPTVPERRMMRGRPGVAATERAGRGEMSVEPVESVQAMEAVESVETLAE